MDEVVKKIYENKKWAFLGEQNKNLESPDQKECGGRPCKSHLTKGCATE